MKTTKTSSKKLKSGTTDWAFPRSLNSGKGTATVAKFVSEDGQEESNVLKVQGNWSIIYKDHPETSSFDNFVKKLYKKGYEADIRKARKELGQHVSSDKQNSLKSLRLEAGLSQAELAEKAGVQQYQISKYESLEGDKPNFTTCTKICDALNIDPNKLYEALGYRCE